MPLEISINTSTIFNLECQRHDIAASKGVPPSEVILAYTANHQDPDDKSLISRIDVWKYPKGKSVEYRVELSKIDSEGCYSTASYSDSLDEVANQMSDIMTDQIPIHNCECSDCTFDDGLMYRYTSAFRVAALGVMDGIKKSG